mgnify:CR=1 FL=1|tara:strand:+ start:97 stop:501 length:405 start_codon:yes stop_codon:yes gene_type:complete
MSLANALKKAASASLKKLGGDITIKKITTGTYIAAFDDIAVVDNITNVDEFIGGVIEESIESFSVKGVVSNFSRNEVNDLIESQDKRLTISAGDLSFVPTTKDRVVISSVEFKIIQINTNEQNNTPISFDLILR